MVEPVKIFIIYAREDRSLLELLKTHFAVFIRRRELIIWDDGEIKAGQVWDAEIKKNLKESEVVLLLLSSDFLASKYVFETELPEATFRHSRGECRIVPILIRECNWEFDEQLEQFQVVTDDGNPIFSGDKNKNDAAFKKASLEIRESSLNFKQSKADVLSITEQKKTLLKIDIQKKFKSASTLLANWTNEFSKIQNSHLERAETHQIIHWIKSPIQEKEKGVALLVGDAGAGKSVILRDVLHELRAQNIPVLGIKADQFCETSLADLEKRLDLQEGIETMVKALLENETNNRVAVLIDQIDALSQVMSARRDFLGTFMQLVEALVDIPDIRVVISCRNYDFQQDNYFHFYQQQRSFQVGKLSMEEVKKVLRDYPAGEPQLPERLLELLRVPLHLDIFCQIYSPKLQFENIHLLRDLYDEYWVLKIVNKQFAERKHDPERCKKLIFKLAENMARSTQLAVSERSFREEFLQEIEYLQSAGVLQNSGEGLTFFHQTFYEYAFAKQFAANSENSIEKYLVQQEQGLHVRACLKMMVEFLRDKFLGDQKQTEYLRVFETILPSSDFLFHIKSLLLSLLGYVKDPFPEEKDIVRRLVFPNELLFNAFVGTVNSRAWLLFLLTERKLETLLPPNLSQDFTERRRLWHRQDLVSGILSRHLSESHRRVLEFLWQLPDELEQKFNLVRQILYRLEIWDENSRAVHFCDKYEDKRGDFFHWDFLEKAAPKNFDWAFHQLKKGVEQEIRKNASQYREMDLNDELAKTTAHFADNYPEQTFDLLLDFQLKNFCEPPENKEQTTPILWDMTWLFLNFDDDPDNEAGIFGLLIRSARNLAVAQSLRFSKFVSENLDSNSATRLLILIEGLRAQPEAYAAEVLRFFKIFMEKKGFEASETLTWRARQLLREAYPFFSDEQKLWAIQAVASIESEREKAEAAADPEGAKWQGYLRLTWLKYLPEGDLEKLASLPAEFDELEKRFPNWRDREPNRVRVSMIVPPLEQNEYGTMSLDEWKSSFKEFEKEYELSFDSNRGGLTEHARQFEAEVKKRPEFFYPLLEALLTASDVRADYLSAGLEGLKDAPATPERTQFLLDLFKRVDPGGWEPWLVRRLVWLCTVFLNAGIDDDFVVEFLLKMAGAHPDPMDDSLVYKAAANDSRTVFDSGFNSVRGVAAHLLTYCFRFKKHENLIFETLERIAEWDLLMVRSQMMPRLANLSALDESRTLRLFLKLTSGNEDLLLEQSPWSAQVLARQNFGAMLPYFENALAHPKIYESMGIILAQIWVEERGDSLPLLERFFEKGDAAKDGTIDVAAYNLTEPDGQAKPRSAELFQRFLTETSDAVVHAYDYSFSKMSTRDFLVIYRFSENFPAFISARKDPHSFYVFLEKCTSEHPDECLELARKSALSEIHSRSYYDRDLLRIVVNTYHAAHRKGNPAAARKALQLFDEMLQDDRFRPTAEEVLRDA